MWKVTSGSLLMIVSALSPRAAACRALVECPAGSVLGRLICVEGVGQEPLYFSTARIVEGIGVAVSELMGVAE